MPTKYVTMDVFKLLKGNMSPVETFQQFYVKLKNIIKLCKCEEQEDRHNLGF